MPMGYRINYYPLEDGMIVTEDVIGVFQDNEGEAFVVTATPVEVHADPSKATEVIGTLEPAKDD